MMAPSLEALSEQAATVSELLKVIANPTRLQILCYLAGGERAVSAFEDALGIRQPGLSQQLALLREAELVATRRHSKVIFYTLADPRVVPLLVAIQAIVTGKDSNRTLETFLQAGAVGRGAVMPTTSAARATECSVFPVVGWPVPPEAEAPVAEPPISATRET